MRLTRSRAQSPFFAVKKSSHFLSTFVAAFFIFSQCVSPVYSFEPLEVVDPAYKTPEINADNPAVQVDPTLGIEDEKLVEEETTLKDEYPLGEAVFEIQTREEERRIVDFETAVTQLVPDYAAAVFLDSISAEELKALTELEVEVGIVVLDNKLVLFTSGSRDELRVNPLADKILEEAQLIAHTHVQGSSNYPSLLDIEAAKGTEYVVSDRVYAYDALGLKGNFPYTYDYLANQINNLTDSYQASDEVIDLLSEFIVAIDAYNASPEDSLLFRSADVTVFPNFPTFSLFDSQTPPANISISQFADPLGDDAAVSVARIDYNTTNGSFGGGLLNFGSNPADLSLNTKFTFDMRTDNNTVSNCPDNPQTNCMKVEFKDNTGNTAIHYISGLTSEFQQIDITVADLLADQPLLDLQSIKEIVFVIEHTRVLDQTQGFLEIRTGGIPFATPIAADPAKTVVDLTQLGQLPSGKYLQTGTFSVDSTAAFESSSNQQATLSYEGNAESAFGGVILSYGTEIVDFDTLFPAGAVIGLKSDNLTEVLFEITDANDKRDQIKLTGISNSTQFYSIVKSDFFGIDLSQIKQAAFVFEGQGSQSLVMEGGIFPYAEVLEPSVFNDTNLHQFSERPRIDALGSRVEEADQNGTITIDQTNAEEFYIDYDVSRSDSSFVVATLTKGLFNDQNVFEGETLNLGDTLELGMRGDGSVGYPARVKVKVVDTNLREAVYELKVSNDFSNYSLDLTDPLIVSPGFDFTSVAKIELIIDQGLVKSLGLSGGVIFKVKGLEFIPDLGGTDFIENELSFISERPAVRSLGGSVIPTDQAGGVFVTQIDEDDLKLRYDVSKSASSFAVFSLTNGVFDNEGTFQGETLNLGDEFVLGLQGDGAKGYPQRVRVKVIDSEQREAVYTLIVRSTMKNYALDFTDPTVVAPDFDSSSIATIELVVDQGLVEGLGLTGELFLKVKGLEYAPSLIGTTENESNLTMLSNNPTVTTNAGKLKPTDVPSLLNYRALSSDSFEFEVDARNKTSFAEVKIEGESPFDFSSGVTFALRGTKYGRTEVEFVDVNGNVRMYRLKNEPVFQNFTMNFSEDASLDGFDASQIARIIFRSDRDVAPLNHMDLIQVKMKGLNLTVEPDAPQDLLDFKDSLVQDALSFFQVGVGVDPVTHFPYDRSHSDGVVQDEMKFTQPTLIGFYAQILGDAVAGHLDNGNTTSQNLTEIEAVIDSLLTVQQTEGWNGLLPWLDLDENLNDENLSIVGVGDNANLAQSLAVMVGALEQTNLAGAEETLAQAIVQKVEQFLDNQEPGYLAFVDGATGLFHASIDIDGNPPVFNHFIDRLNTEFRGAIAFLKVRYPSLPDSVWNNMTSMQTVIDYPSKDGRHVYNLSSFEGGAFQTFWPNLRNSESDFIGLRNVQYNHLVTQLDFANRNNLPGILSASDVPDRSYYGRIGIPQIAETWDKLVANSGSTYALASAYHIAPEIVLTWLKSISDQIPEMNGPYGLLDAASSASEVSEYFFGIDIASTILGLTDKGHETFKTYLKNRNAEQTFNEVYTRANWIGVNKTEVDFEAPPEFPDRSVSVFRTFESAGVINNIVDQPTEVFGLPFTYQSLDNGFGGRFWNMAEPIKAAANKLIISYTATILPDKLKVELKNGADDLLFENTVDLFNGAKPFRQLIFNLPNEASLNEVQKIVLVAEDQDIGDFFIHSIDFQHFASLQNLLPDSGLGSSDVTDLPGGADVLTFSSGGNVGFAGLGQNVYRFTFDLEGTGFAGVSIDYDAAEPGRTIDLSASSSFIFGVNSDKVRSFRLEVEDKEGKRASVFIRNVDTSRNYYTFLNSLIGDSIDLTQVKKITFIVDQEAVVEGIGSSVLDLEIGGLSLS